MSGTHKYPTISFRISPREREEIEAKIFASGMKKKDYFVRSCIYNRVMCGREERNSISDCGKITGNAEPYGRTGRADKRRKAGGHYRRNQRITDDI